ncbi:MAG: hypothetical protein ACLFTL_04965 [Alphaproteobacteria bacterium]
MNEERYPGERRGLKLFLEGLLGAVDEQLGRDALLYHRIRTALERGDLASLRAARQMFNHQDTALKRRLSLAREQRRAKAGSVPRLVVADGDANTAPAAPPPRSAAIVTLPVPPRGGGD